MIKFFKFIGPFQLGVIFILPFIFRLPLFFSSAPLLAEDLKHFIVGEKLNEGFLLYRDLIDDTSPISAIFYWIVEALFGRSIITYWLLSCLLVSIQAILLIFLCAKHELLSQKTAFIGLVYVVCSLICYDFLSLSPALISVTFLLLSMDSIFNQIKSDRSHTDFYSSGLFIGFAYLSFPPCAIFIVLFSLILFVFTRATVNNYLVFWSGFLFPILLVVSFFFWTNGLEAFLKCYVLNINFASVPQLVNYGVAFLIIIPTAVICLIGVLRSLSYRRFINYQVVCQRVILFVFVATILFLFSFYRDQISSFTILLPFIGFFATHFFQLIIRKKEIGDYILFLYLCYCASFIYSFLNIHFLQNDSINFNNQVVKATELNQKISNKRIAVLGNNKALLLNNKLAGPYLDWKLSKGILEKSDQYNFILAINKAFASDLPQIIVDNEQIVPRVFYRLPLLAKNYRSIENGIYSKKTAIDSQ
jgi:hypothetical protein